MDIYTKKIDSITLFPALPYNLESAVCLRELLKQEAFDCLALPFSKDIEASFLHACHRLPDLTVIPCSPPILVEPVDPFFEAARSFLERSLPLTCIGNNPKRSIFFPQLPDPSAIAHIGHQRYFQEWEKHASKQLSSLDKNEQYLASRLTSLKLQYEKLLFLCDPELLLPLAKRLEQNPLLPEPPALSETCDSLFTLKEEKARELLSNYGFIAKAFESHRENQHPFPTFPKALHRSKLLYALFKKAQAIYDTQAPFPLNKQPFKTFMKFTRNYALVLQKLSLNLGEILDAATACVDSHFSYHLWEQATHYPFLKNSEKLVEKDFSIQDFWPREKRIKFSLKQKSPKQNPLSRYKNAKARYRFSPPSFNSICSHTPEDKVIEDFGHFLKKKSQNTLKEQSAQSLPFSTSLEDGVDIKESLRHWHEKKLYVKVNRRQRLCCGSVVAIFDLKDTDYPWKSSWLGEHEQESDMAFYASDLRKDIIGPGISRCRYGGFMMSTPPRRLFNPFQDPDYQIFEKASEVLLAAAIDYSLEPLVTYLAPKVPSEKLKRYAAYRDKKIFYLPLKELAPTMIQKIRIFHVLEGYERRQIADEFIF